MKQRKEENHTKTDKGNKQAKTKIHRNRRVRIEIHLFTCKISLTRYPFYVYFYLKIAKTSKWDKQSHTNNESGRLTAFSSVLLRRVCRLKVTSFTACEPVLFVAPSSLSLSLSDKKLVGGSGEPISASLDVFQMRKRCLPQ